MILAVAFRLQFFYTKVKLFLKKERGGYKIKVSQSKEDKSKKSKKYFDDGSV